jgi:uncharacterized protein (DUF952 family)
MAENWTKRDNNLTPLPPTMFHLTPFAVWRAQSGSNTYIPEPFEREGFIHCTDGQERVIDVANRYYSGDPRPYCLLEIERSQVSAPVVYEDPERVYPHIYGPLNIDAVRVVRSVGRDGMGRFVGLGERLTDLDAG